MDPVNIQTSIVLSRVATGTIPFGRAVERAGANKCALFGGTTLDNCQVAWTTGGAETVVSTPASVLDTSLVMNDFANTAVPTTQIIASIAKANVDLSGSTNFGILILVDAAVAAGDLTFRVTDTVGGDEDVTLPALVANQWTWVSLPFGGVGTDRDVVNAIAVVNTSGGNLSTDVTVAFVGYGEATYGIAGFANDDQAVEDDQAVLNDAVNILAAGNLLVPLAGGMTTVAEQQVYAIPGSGKLTTVEIVYSVGANRPITATEDQATAAGNVGVRL